MFKFILLIVFVCAVYSVPIGCENNDIGAVATLGLTESEVEVMGLFKKKSPCQENGRVCVHYCSSKRGWIFLGRKIYLSDFVEKSSGTAQAKAKAYEDACVRRTMAKSMKNFLYRRALRNILRKLQSLPATHTKRNDKWPEAKKKFGRLLEYLEKYGTTIEKYFGQLGELTTLYGKVCRNEKQWRRKIKTKLTDFFNGGYKKQLENEKNLEIKKMINEKFEKLKTYRKEVSKNKRQFEILQNINKRFVRRFAKVIMVTVGDRRYCLCRDYINRPGVSVSKNIRNMIKNECEKKYGN